MIVRIEAKNNLASLELKSGKIIRDSSVYKDCYVPSEEMLVEWARLQINKLIHAGATTIVATFTKE
jgi:hypothetical protein